MRLYTDYPIVELGDLPGKRAPIRAARLLRFDGNKYATVEVDGITVAIKWGYLYRDRSRCGLRKTKHMTWKVMMRFHGGSRG